MGENDMELGEYGHYIVPMCPSVFIYQGRS